MSEHDTGPVSDCPSDEERIAQAVAAERERCALIAEYWGEGHWRVKHDRKKRFDIFDMQGVCNSTGRAIAEDIRKENP